MYKSEKNIVDPMILALFIFIGEKQPIVWMGYTVRTLFNYGFQK